VAREPGDGSITITIGVESLMNYSDQHLRQTFGHELGHIARDGVSGGVKNSNAADDPGQLAAEAFALKLMGTDLYRRVQLVAMNRATGPTEELIKTLAAINERFPDS
jgi:hypothetical protein